MPGIMDKIGAVLRKGHFEIQNTKDKKKTFGFQREKTGFIERIMN